MDSLHTLYKTLGDPVAHDSLKAAIRAFINCDPVDAANDAEWLAEVMQLRAREVAKLALEEGHLRPAFVIRDGDAEAPT